MSKVRDIDFDDDNNIKIESVECLLNLISRYQDLVKTDQQFIPIIELIFKNMLELENEISEEWSCPPDGFNDDLVESDDQKVIKAAMNHVDQLFRQFETERLVNLFTNYIQKMLTVNDWKYTHGAIMTISQIAEYIEDDDQIGQLVNILVERRNHANPRVRYSICHALGQLADDQSPYFQESQAEKYFQIVIPYLNDPVPRVVAHALASLTNFLESANADIVDPYYDQLLQAFLYLLDKGIVFVKEAVLSAMSAFAESCTDKFESQFDFIINMIFNIFAYSEKKEFKQLVSNAMEAVTILGSVYGYEKFQKYVPKVIQELIKIQQMKIRQDPSEVDNQVSYLLSSWQRMAFLCNENLLPYIDNIMPSLLEVIKAPLWNMQEDEGASRTSNLEDMEIALQMISLFMKQYSKNLGKYLHEIYNILTLINVKIQNQELQISAFSLLPKIIKVAKDNQIDYKPLSK